MSRVVSLIQSLNFILAFLLVGISTGLIFVMAIMWNNDRVSVLLLGIASISCVLALNTFAGISQDPRIDWSSLNGVRVSTTLLMITAGIYHFMMKEVIKNSEQADGQLQYAVSFIVIMASIYLWAGSGIQISGEANTVEVHWGLLIACFVLVALVLDKVRVAFLLREQFGRNFSVAGILLVGALVLVILAPDHSLLLETGFVGAANVLVGWPHVQAQMLQPVDIFEEELTQKRRDMARIVAELTAVKKDREELMKSLELASQYRNEFLSNMSHELRTPLNSIIGYSELLHNRTYGELTEKQAERLERIRRNGIQLLDIITDILDLNQLDGGKLELQVAAFNLSEVIKEVVDSYREACLEKGIDCQVVVSDKLPHVFGDRIRIAKLIENIVDNAVKFTDSGDIRVVAEGISVSSGRCDDFPLPTIGWLRDGDWILLRIADTGIGIAPEDQAHIFEEFTQVESDGTRVRGGTGVGLAVARKLAELHSGSIWVKSQLSKGSEFFVALPSESLE